jgi:hypothetical protein
MTNVHVDRFIDKLIVCPDGCWRWMGQTAGGYGRFYIIGEKRTVPAHRFAYEWLVGPIPEGLCIDHLCRVRNCVNPDHMEPVTNRENLMRGETIVARAAAATHCPKGHPYSPDNTGSDRGNRRCKTCNRETARNWRKRHPGYDAAKLRFTRYEEEHPRGG